MFFLKISHKQRHAPRRESRVRVYSLKFKRVLFCMLVNLLMYVRIESSINAALNKNENVNFKVKITIFILVELKKRIV